MDSFLSQLCLMECLASVGMFESGVRNRKLYMFAFFPSLSLRQLRNSHQSEQIVFLLILSYWWTHDEPKLDWILDFAFALYFVRVVKFGPTLFLNLLIQPFPHFICLSFHTWLINKFPCNFPSQSYTKIKLSVLILCSNFCLIISILIIIFFCNLQCTSLQEGSLKLNNTFLLMINLLNCTLYYCPLIIKTAYLWKWS